ncbi:MAG: DUF2339 domain-containing protein [Phycisphaerae bacterium]|jgi:uncharacterized membrane protein
MEELFILLILLVVCCILSGPVALIISINTLNRLKSMHPEPKKPQEELFNVPKKPPKPVEAIRKEPLPMPSYIRTVEEKKSVTKEIDVDKIAKPKLLLEQRIGTQWILVAGVITVIVGVGFFLKYTYDNNLIGPLGRVVIAAISGLIALAIGEITRRRGYEIVAKAVTSLGFAILYAAVFSAYRFYELITPMPTFVLAVFITVAAMFYAISVNEVLVAFLSLLGGFLTPVLISTGENLPMPLFSYVLILSVGAMLCAYYRKWRAINVLAFLGTFLLYTGWFEKFYRPAMRTAQGVPEQLAIATIWLWVFFAVYLLLPILSELVKKVKAKREDVLLVLANAAVVFYYLWNILFDKYRISLAFCAIGLCVAHLIMMSIVNRRYKEDLNLRLALLVIGLFFATIAVPLYLKMYAVAMAWAVEGVILAIIGLKYRSIWTQIGGAVAFALSVGQLLNQLPMHTAAFQIVFNPAFGSWCFVSAAVFVCHIIYRRRQELEEVFCRFVPQVLYAVSMLLLMAALLMEWYWRWKHNLFGTPSGFFLRGATLIFAVFPLLFVLRPLSPTGLVCKILASILAITASVFTMATFPEFYHTNFTIFANLNFIIILTFVASLFVGAWLLKRSTEEEKHRVIFMTLFLLLGVFVLWVLLTEQIYLYWYCRNRFAPPMANWKFLSHMYISVMWAIYGAVLMIVGFWRRVGILRYIALGLFVLLLAKVFILDTSTVKSVYRIAAFLATGVTLVGVSYLYQFLKKRGFFETVLAEGKSNK